MSSPARAFCILRLVHLLAIRSSVGVLLLDSEAFGIQLLDGSDGRPIMPRLEDRVNAQMEEQLRCGTVLGFWLASVLRNRVVYLGRRCAIRV